MKVTYNKQFTALQVIDPYNCLSEFGCKEFRFFPRGEVATLVDLVEISDVAIGTLGPALWRTVDLARAVRLSIDVCLQAGLSAAI